MGGFRPTPAGFLHFFVDWFNGNVADHDVGRIVLGDAYVVWFCFVLGRAKCLVSTTRPDHRYYELTYVDFTSQTSGRVNVKMKVDHFLYDR